MQNLIQALEARLFLSACPATVKTKVAALQTQAASINIDFAALASWEQSERQHIGTAVQNAKPTDFSAQAIRDLAKTNCLTKKSLTTELAADKRAIVKIRTDLAKLSKHPTDAALQTLLTRDRGVLFAAVPTDQKLEYVQPETKVPSYFILTDPTTLTPVFTYPGSSSADTLNYTISASPSNGQLSNLINSSSSVLVTSPSTSLTTCTGGSLDLSNNDVIINDSNLTAIASQGDANLDGTVSDTDYQQIDTGICKSSTSWQNGDFNYDGIVNGSDYALIDDTYNQIAPTAAAPLAVIAPVDPVNPPPG